MINRYLKGRKKEYKIMHEAKGGGKIVFRSAGSHSPIDVVVINRDERTIRFIQSKAESMSENKREALRQEFNFLNGAFICKFEVI